MYQVVAPSSSMVNKGLDRLRHFVCRLLPRRLLQPPADRVLLEAPPEPLADAHALTGSSPNITQKRKRDGYESISFFVGAP